MVFAASRSGRNLTDREPQRSEFAGVLGALHDPLNRVFYARAVYDLPRRQQKRGPHFLLLNLPRALHDVTCH